MKKVELVVGKKKMQPLVFCIIDSENESRIGTNTGQNALIVPLHSLRSQWS